MAKNKDKNKRGGKGGHQGGASHVKITADQVKVLEKLSQRESRRSEKEDMRRTARRAARYLKRGEVGSDTSSSDSTSESSSDEGVSSKSKRRMKKKWRKKHDKETKELQSKLTTEQQKNEELELLRNKTTAALTPSKDAAEGDGQNEPRKFTLAEWQSLQQEASVEVRPVVPVKKGLFHDLFTEDTASKGSVSSAPSIISEIDKNLTIADKRQKLSLGVSVPAAYEKRARVIANACASKHFDSDEFIPKLQSLLTKYDLNSSAKRCNTVLLALIRAVISRQIDIELEELGLEEDDLDGGS